jgi:glyoxylase-like metal-dependent hydrolase (beta-lactamase superfamily II)
MEQATQTDNPQDAVPARVPTPTAYPSPGTYHVTQRITLLCGWPGARMAQFQNGHAVYMHHADLPLVMNFNQNLHYDIDTSKIRDIREGFTFDLGGRRLDIYEVPGHTPGCIVLLDEANGYLFSGDAVGSNRPTIVDSLWMQNKHMAPIDVYLPTLKGFRSKVRGKIKEILTGHNDTPLYGEAYLDNLQQAAQNLVENGIDVLVPSLRPTGVWQVVAGDRMKDPNWAAINVSKETCLSR